MAYTAQDIAKMTEGYRTGHAGGFTERDIKNMLKPYSEIKVDKQAEAKLKERMKQKSKPFSEVVPEFHRFESSSVPVQRTAPAAKQQKQAENAARLDALAGRTGAQKDLLAPISRPQAIRDFTTGDIVQTVVPKAQSEKQSGGLLAGIQNLMEAANPVAKGVDMLRYLQNQEQAKAQADGIADQRIMELREQAKTNPAVLHSDEYIKAMSRPVSLFSGMVRDIPQIDPEGKSSLDRIAPVMQSKRAEAQNELLEGKTGLGKMGTQALLTGADMLGSAGLAGMTGVPFLGVMAGQSGADAGQRALDEGHSYDKAALFAAGTGGITAGIESFGGAAGKWGDDAARALAKTKIGQAVLSKVPAAVGQKLSALASSKLGKIAADALSEGSEEFAEYYAQNFFENLMLDKDTPYDVRVALESAAVGSMFGGMFGGGRAAADLFTGRNVNAQAAQPAQENTFTQRAGTDANAAQSAAQVDSAGAQALKQNALRKYLGQIVGAMKGELASDSPIRVGETPDILRKYGAQSRTITLNQSDIRKIAYPEGYMGGKHNLGFHALEVLPQQLENPVAILKSSSQPNSLVIFTELLDTENRPVMVAMHLDKNGVLGLTNHVASMYGRKNFENFIAAERAAGNILYENEEKDLSWLPVSGLQLPEMEAKTDPINITLPQQAEGVNTSIPGSGAENDMLKKFGLDNLRPKQATAGMPEDIADLRPGKENSAPQAGFEEVAGDLMRKYGAKTESEFLGVADRSDYDEYMKRDQQAEEDRIASLLDEIDRRNAARRETVQKTVAGNDRVSEAVAAVMTPGADIAEGGDLSDVAELLSSEAGMYNKDISRALDAAARGADSDGMKLSKKERQRVRDALYQEIEKPWLTAKAEYTAAVRKKIGNVAQQLEKLGIEAGSKESAAVQWIGEGRRQQKNKLVPYTMDDLKRDFPDSWEKIVKAERMAREVYDDYVGKINAARQKIYPDIEAKAKAEEERLNQKAAYYSAQAQIQDQRIEKIRNDAQRAQQEGLAFPDGSGSRVVMESWLLNLEQQLSEAKRTRDRMTALAERAGNSAAEIERQIQAGDILRGKRLNPRKDYFHHFTEMAEGFGGLANILNSPSEISSALAGISEYTKPKSKFWGALLKRKGGAYTEDAVGGLARYIPSAEYAIHIDPFIAHMRGTIANLAEATSESKNANGLIEYLTDWTGDLAGKTNFLDRPLQKILNRKTMKALEWANNRAKANAVVGNIGSAIVQIGNIPNAMTYVPDPTYWAQAAAQRAKELTGKEHLTEQSPFLQERYLGEATDRMVSKSLLRKGAEGALEFGDREAAKLIWLAAYNQYNREGSRRGTRTYEDAVDYADDITRRSVAGRGIGEMPLTQKSRIIKLFAPFQVEVNNTYHVMRDLMRDKDAMGLAAYCAAAWIINGLTEAIAGKRALFDPVEALADVFKDLGKDDDDERNALEKTVGAAARLGGEVVSNLPYASAAATALAGTENSEKLFGEQDPTRFGTGNIAVQTMLEPIAKLGYAGATGNAQEIDLLAPLTAFGPAYGGKQMEKTVKAAQDLGMLPDLRINTRDGISVERNKFPASRSESGRIRFPIEIQGAPDMLRMLTFGPWATKEGKEYIDQGRSPISDKQTEKMEAAFEAGILPTTFYNALIAQRSAKGKDLDGDGKNDSLTKAREQKRLIDEATPEATFWQRQKLYEAFGVSEKVW